MDRRIRAVRKLAKSFGREVEFAHGHMKLVDPSRRLPTVVASGSPKDFDAALRAIRRDLVACCSGKYRYPVSAGVGR
jgi:hypothetical protein